MAPAEPGRPLAPSLSVIQLIGPGGAGKSTVGALLARRLGWPSRDLDREFERRHADIDAFIHVHGYAAYARENVATYLELIPHLRSAVLALSSGFMTYPATVHPAYDGVRAAIVRSRTTLVLLPSLDRETCVAETVRRQLGRPICRRDAAAEEAVIRERFGRYLALPAPKVETMRPPDEVVAAIHARLAADAPELVPAERWDAGHREAID
ncbi:MAG TPA: shikimate kinase [Gemmatirosa sp.]|nr:shikimate kinase [Gemmatirosa sp.]